MREARYWFGYGFKSKERARAALEDAFACGDISEGERPELESYRGKSGGLVWGIRAVYCY